MDTILGCRSNDAGDGVIASTYAGEPDFPRRRTGAVRRLARWAAATARSSDAALRTNAKRS